LRGTSSTLKEFFNASATPSLIIFGLSPSVLSNYDEDVMEKSRNSLAIQIDRLTRKEI